MNLKPGMLNGVIYKEVMKLNYEGQEFEVEIKPLTHNQSSQIQSIMQSGIELTRGVKPEEDFSNVKLDIEKNTEAMNRALVLACGYGTTDASWNEFNIDAEWPAEWISIVGKRIFAISGIGDPQEVERFRNERNGSK